MAVWDRNKVDSTQLNGGNEYDSNSQFALDEMNAIVNGGLYSQDFAEHLADTPDNTLANQVGTAEVEVVDNVVGGKTYKKFKFKNLKGVQGVQGIQGVQGVGISNVAKTSTNVLVDTYTITYTNSTTTTFNVTNGKSISSIAKTSSLGLVDTYTITYNDNSTSSFNITNGDSVEMRYNSGNIQWKYTTGSTWTTLLSLDSTPTNGSLNAITSGAVYNHTSNTSNPHNVTATNVGLGNCDNTSDANKPISTAQATVNELKVDKEYSTDYAYTEGLVFSWDTDHYIVGDNTSNPRNAYPVGTETEFVIPKYYDDGTHGTALVTEIVEDAFRAYKLIVDISIPDSITSIGNYAFYNCDNLAKVIIPNSVITIGISAFDSCDNLAKVIIPNSVITISDFAFADCDSLTSIVIPNSVTSIGNCAFNNCNNLANVIIPNSVTSIGADAFSNCAFSSVTLPSSITSLGAYAFAPNANLTKAYIYAITPPATNGGMFPNVSGILEAIYVPYESLEAYKTATDWSTYASRIYPIPDGKDLTDRLDLKLDKTTTGSLRRVYGVNASNVQELTEIKTTAIENSTDLITSGGVYTILGDIETLLAGV